MFLSKIQENHKTFQKKEVWRKLGRVLIKNLFAQSNLGHCIWDGKYWTGLESFNIYFCVLSDCYCQSLIPGREAGH